MNQILMEEDIEDKPSMFYDPLGLHATERSFYDPLGQQYPAFPNQGQPPPHVNRKVESPDDAFSGGSNGDYGTNSSSSTSTSSDPQWPSISQTDPTGDPLFRCNSQLNGGSNFLANPFNSVTNIGDGLEFLGQNSFTDTLSVMQFRRGLEEASKFLPRGNQLVGNLNSSVISPGWKEEDREAEKSDRGNSTDGSRGRKNLKRDDVALEEGRTNKQSAVYVEESDLVMFDGALSALCVNYRRLQISEASKALPTNGQPQGAHGGKSISAKKQGKKKDTVDLNALLMLCAQAVSAGDTKTANELLRQISQHSSPFDDGSQRLAHFFANALEARLAGTGTGIGTQLFCTSLASKRISSCEILKASKAHLSACPYDLANICYQAREGAWYQPWRCKARGDTVLHGCGTSRGCGTLGGGAGHSDGSVVGRLVTRTRLSGRKRMQGVYHAIASCNWETIRIEDLKLDSNDTLVVNCLYRFKYLHDETVLEADTKDAVLKLIRRMNPYVFVHSIFNGSFNAPFFVSRFREALFHYSAMYDTLDVTIPRENHLERLTFEKEFYGKEVMNVIACEGRERVERPETYKQWQLRTLRAGFRQLPLDKELLNHFKSRMKESIVPQGFRT
ncbi:Scarecrow-like protein 14 [Morella rubra]|uniref:Scarecrow-like protein 14 n=1 Tax=Morella rubra TaxID=262757 RepID=A0A6A1URV4_9ROSI|nr:Scarecrow-like protein 14 [Morella rubra]